MKNFLLEQFLEPLSDDDSYFTKRMFGGLSIYYNGLMVLVLTEKPGDREWGGGISSFDIWNGVLVSTSREHHVSLQKEFTALIDHPVIAKWQYLPMDDDSFENQLDSIVEAILKKDSRIGIIPGLKKRSKKKTKSKKKSKLKTKKKVKTISTVALKKKTKPKKKPSKKGRKKLVNKD